MASLARRVLRNGKRIAGDLYRDNIRPLMPRTGPVRYAGELTMHDWRLFDRMLPANFRPWVVNDMPDYEEALVAGLRAHVKPGHTVVVVGGGEGSTAVVAKRLAGAEGKVILFEAAASQLPIIAGTAARNALELDVRHGAVGEAIGVYGGENDSSPVVAPEDLPECDVLELDCEGAERIIFDRMTIRPPVVIVETHGIYGAPTEGSRAQLEALGYEVADMGWAEPRVADECREHDVRVLIGRRKA